jgi:hypothetical protein
MAGTMGAYNYVSDDLNTYRVRLDDTNAAAVGAAAATTAVPKPQSMHARYLLAQHPTTGRERRITCPNPTNTLWVGDGTVQVISLRDYDTNLAVNFIVAGRIGERRFAS